MPELIHPDWPAPPNVRTCVTTRIGGVSAVPFDSFNLGLHVGDDPTAVEVNRQRLRTMLPAEPHWLEQVHGIEVADADALHSAAPQADASVARRRGSVCVVMTADCLPVLFCDSMGSVVAAAHAGWRGLCAGVLEKTVAAMQVPPGSIMAWLGPAIDPAAFEVGKEVRAAFISADPDAATAFVAASNEGKWFTNLFLLARQRLLRCGVHEIHGGGLCTWSDARRFYSYRRDGRTGRFASLIWRDG